MKESVDVTTSSNVVNLTYDNETLELFVTFKGGRSYVYHNVPEYVFDAITRSASIGEAVHSYLHDVSYERIT